MTIKKYLFSGFVTFSFLSMTNPVLANMPDVTKDDPALQKVVSETQALESQIKLLKAEIRQLKKEQTAIKATQKASFKNVSALPPTVQTKSSIASVADITAGTPMVIAPYVGERRSFDASDLMVNYSSYNEDLRLLYLRQKMYAKMGNLEQSPTSFFLMLSGKIEGLGFYQKASDNVSKSGLSLEDAELDIAPVLNRWASGYMALKYADSNEAIQHPIVQNGSRVHIDKAFLTIGDLEQFPFYITMGQFNVPFGTYASSMISSPLTDVMFKTKAQALLLGYALPSDTGLYAQTFVFNGDTKTNRSDNIDDIGANVGFKFDHHGWHGDIGASVINNVADSLGMQQTGADNGFRGFSDTLLSSEKLQRQVAGVGVHANIGTGPFNLNSGYIRSTSAFNPQDLSFNDKGAQPQAVNIEGSYSMNLLDRPAAFILGFGKTWDALALAVPKERYTAAFTTSIWKDTIQEIEFHHDNNYSTTDVATGGSSLSIPGTGGSKNTIEAQIGIYF